MRSTTYPAWTRGQGTMMPLAIEAMARRPVGANPVPRLRHRRILRSGTSRACHLRARRRARQNQPGSVPRLCRQAPQAIHWAWELGSTISRPDRLRIDGEEGMEAVPSPAPRRQPRISTRSRTSAWPSSPASRRLCRRSGVSSSVLEGETFGSRRVARRSARHVLPSPAEDLGGHVVPPPLASPPHDRNDRPSSTASASAARKHVPTDPDGAPRQPSCCRQIVQPPSHVLAVETIEADRPQPGLDVRDRPFVR